jgi:hypothetical protein
VVARVDPNRSPMVNKNHFPVYINLFSFPCAFILMMKNADIEEKLVSKFFLEGKG